jgi:hypothetical protein
VIWGQDDVNIQQSALQRGLLGNGRAGSASTFGVERWANVLRHLQDTAAARLELDTLGKTLYDVYKKYDVAPMDVEHFTSYIAGSELAKKYDVDDFRSWSAKDENKYIEAANRLETIRKGTFTPETAPSVQTTEFLRQIEAKLFFKFEAQARRNKISLHHQITELRKKSEAKSTPFLPSYIARPSAKRERVGAGQLEGHKKTRLSEAFDKLEKFADSVGAWGKRKIVGGL